MRASTTLASALFFCTCCGHTTKQEAKPGNGTNDAVVESMQQNDMQAVRNNTIQFVTMRPPGSNMPTADRQVVLTGPPEAVALAKRGDIAVLDQLVPLLADPERAWAAEVMLAAMTGHEADIVNSFQATPSEWLQDMSQGARERWQKWLDGVRDKLQWDATRNQFVMKQ